MIVAHAKGLNVVGTELYGLEELSKMMLIVLRGKQVKRDNPVYFPEKTQPASGIQPVAYIIQAPICYRVCLIKTLPVPAPVRVLQPGYFRIRYSSDVIVGIEMDYNSIMYTLFSPMGQGLTMLFHNQRCYRVTAKNRKGFGIAEGKQAQQRYQQAQYAYKATSNCSPRNHILLSLSPNPITATLVTDP
jgi:hypothetical protein